MPLEQPGMAIEQAGADAWIVETLSADTTLAALVAQLWAALQQPPVSPAPSTPPGRWIFGNVAPENTAFPYIVFGQHVAKDKLGAFGQRLYVDCTYYVRVVAPGMGPGFLYPIASRVDDLLSVGSVNSVVNGVTVIGCTRSTAIRMEHTLEDVRYQFVGGMYRILLSQ